MPAVMPEYDYYGYARSRQGVAKNAIPVSRTSTKQEAHKPTSEITKEAIRKALRDEYVGSTTKKQTTRTATYTNVVSTTRKKTKTAEIEPVVFQKKEKLQKPQEMKLKKMEAIKKERVKKVQKQKAKVKETIQHILMAGVLFAMFFLICYRYTTINESFNELSAVKSTLREKETINEQMESSIKKNTDLSYIESYAKYQLGMQKPKESQIRKIIIDKKDKITTPIELKEEKEKSTVEKLIDDFLKIID